MAAQRVVLVTGGAGFIGSHLVDACIERGWRTRVLDNLSTGLRENLNPAAELVEADIRRPAAISSAFSGVDCVFHTAALPRVSLSIANPLETHLVNVVGTLNVLMATREAGVRRLVYSGSSSVYGAQRTLPLSEDLQPYPLNPYALQKLTGEGYVRLFHQLYGVETLSLRYFNVFGPRMTMRLGYMTVISVFLAARLEGKPLPIYGDGEQTRDFTHVRDVVRANLMAMESAVADGRALNIGRGKNLSINSVARLFGGPTVRLPPRAGDPRDTLANCSQAAEVLGWRPEVSTEAGILEILRTAGFAANR